MHTHILPSTFCCLWMQSTVVGIIVDDLFYKSDDWIYFNGWREEIWRLVTITCSQEMPFVNNSVLVGCTRSTGTRTLILGCVSSSVGVIGCTTRRAVCRWNGPFGSCVV